jgi:6-pyruvoyl-tetrahydropterin synthase related domain
MRFELKPPPWSLAAAGYLIVFAVVTWPLTVRFTHATYGGPGDGWALIWQTRFRFDHGVSYFSPTYSTDVGWPVGTHLTSSLFLSSAAVELPNLLLLAIGVSDVVAYNLITLAAALTSSLAMYALLRRVRCRPTVAFWGGLVYLIAPWHLVKLGIHPTLASMAALPLLLLGIVEWIGRPNLKSGALVVIAAALATYTHSYYGLAAGAVLVASLPIVLVTATRRRTLGRVATRTAILAGALVLVPLPLALALHVQASSVSAMLDRPLYLAEFGAHHYLWLLPSVDNPVFGGLSRRYIAARSLQPNEGELALYLGWLTIALAAVGLGVAGRNRALRPAAAVAATMAVVGALLSLPGYYPLPLLGTIKMPVAYLNDFVTFVSTPARFFALTLTGVVALAGLGLESIAKRLSRGWALAAVGTACCFSAVELPYFGGDRVVDTRSPPVVRAIEETVPPGEPVAQYPSMQNSYRPIALQLFYQVQHGHPLVNGALPSSPEDAVRIAVENERSPQTPRILALLGVRWATYDQNAEGEKAVLIGTPTLEQAANYTPPPGFHVVRRLGDGSMLMRVTAKPAPAFASIAEGFSSEGRWLMRTNGTLLACASAGGEHTLRFRAGAFAMKRRFRIGNGRIVEVSDSPRVHKVRTRIRLRAGWQFLPIEVLGSKPIRPSDVIPGEPDSRPLTVTIGPITVVGPHGSADRCGHSPPLSDIPTVG